MKSSVHQQLRLAVCCLNVSEGQNHELLEKIARAAVTNQEKWTCNKSDQHEQMLKCKSTVLSVYMDKVFNRGNITIAAPVEYLSHSVIQACKVAYENIDLTQHTNPGHPRLGSVDLIPIHPISNNVTLEMCSDVVITIATTLSSDVPETSFYYFGITDPHRRGLVQRRKTMNWFSENCKTQTPDLGVYNRKYGISGIGATPYMSVLNVLLETTSLSIGNEIANSIRESNKETGLAGIQAMAFLKNGGVEIACNVDTNSLNQNVTVFKTTFEDLEEKIKDLSGLQNIKVIGESLRGFTPKQAYDLAANALYSGNSQVWKDAGLTVM